MLSRKCWWQIATVLILMTASVVSFIYWNEARKEVVYLCQNFNKGVLKSSVIRQIETVNLSRYFIEESPTGSNIILNSVLNFGQYKCIIKSHKRDKVEQAHIE
jgi:hypothetical protein